MEPLDSVPADYICSVCLGPVADATARVTLGCNHRFHLACLAPHANSNLNGGNPLCPNCRAPDGGIELLRRVMPTAPPSPVAFAQPDDALEPSSGPPTALPTPTVSFVASVGGCADASAPVRGLLCVRVPAVPAVDEKPVDYVILVDRSGSMAADNKLTRTKEALRWVVRDLNPRSRAAIHAFDNVTERLTPLVRGTFEGKARLMAAIESLRASGGTSIDPALSSAAEVLEARAERNPGALVLLLTDGLDFACRGAPYAERVKAAGGMVYVLGVGADHDAPLLVRVSAAGGGSFAYAEKADDIKFGFAAATATAATLVGARAVIETPAGDCITVGLLLTGQTAYFPYTAHGAESSAVLKYWPAPGDERVVEVRFSVPVTGADEPADAETMALVGAHESRVDAAAVLKASARLASAGESAHAVALVRQCAERIRERPAHALSAALLADLAREEVNLSSRRYDRAASLAMAVSHGTQMATGTLGALYSTESQTLSMRRSAAEV